MDLINNVALEHAFYVEVLEIKANFCGIFNI